MMPTNCSAAKQLPQFYKHSKSADLLRKSLLSHVWRVPSSKALSCKHERLFDLLTLVSSYYNRFQNIPQPDFSDPFSFYSFRSAVTGSLFAALRDGIRPPMKVRNTLRPISTIAGSAGSEALT